MKKISVIVPVYNVENYIYKCLESIINQTYKNLEIILVNDGSTDNSGKICDEYAIKDVRIKTIHKQNGGLSDARNAGLDIATGDYLSFIDSDDYIALDMYDVLYNQMIKDGTDIAVTKLIPFVEGQIPKENDLTYSYVLNVEEFFGSVEFNVTACNRLYNAKLWKNIRFPYGKLHEDVFVEHLITGQCDKISCVEKGMYFYLKRNSSIMNSTFNIRRLDAIDAYLVRLNYMKKNRYTLGIESTLYALINRMREAESYHKCFTDYEYKIFKEKKHKIVCAVFHNIILSGLELKKRLQIFLFFLPTGFSNGILKILKKAKCVFRRDRFE